MAKTVGEVSAGAEKRIKAMGQVEQVSQIKQVEQKCVSDAQINGAKLLVQTMVFIMKLIILLIKNLVELKICNKIVSMVVFIYFFFTLINTTHAETVPGLPANFVPMNGGKTPFEGKISKMKCLD